MKESKKIELFWNFVASVVNSSEAIFVLVTATRVCGLASAGVFSIAFPIGNLLMCVGKYGMRSFQVTDVSNCFESRDYFFHKRCTVWLMISCTIVYVFFSASIYKYSIKKVVVIFLTVLIYAIEAYEEFFVAELQKNRKLALAMKRFSIRWTITLVVWCVGLLLVKHIVLATALALISDLIAFVVLWRKEIKSLIISKIVPRRNTIIVLFRECWPLCCASLCSFYLPNASRYAIDGILQDSDQAILGYITMPIFVIDLLVFIIFQPFLRDIAVEWENREYVRFFCIILKIFVCVLSLGVLTTIIGSVMGLPILSALYGVDLHAYLTELQVVLIAGIGIAIIGLLNTILTILRHQKVMMYSYVFVSICSLVIMKKVVYIFGLTGTILCNAMLIYFLLLLLGIETIYIVKHEIITKI